MKTDTVEKTWPRIKVEYHGPRPHEIITIEEAVEKYGLDDRTVKWFRTGGLAGTSANNRPNSEGVYMLRLYTLEDSIRDAAPSLLKALEGIMDWDLVPKESVAGRMALAAIREAHRE